MLVRGLDVEVIAQRHELSSVEKEMVTPQIDGVTLRYDQPFVECAKRIQYLIPLVFKPNVWVLFRDAFKNKRLRLHLSLLGKALTIFAICQANSRRYDIAHCYFGHTGIIGAYLKSLGVVKSLIVSFLGYDISRLTRPPKPISYSYLFKVADRILPISSYMQRKLIELGANPKTIAVNHMGVDLKRFDLRPLPTRDEPVRIISVARFTEKKGIEYAIRSLPRVLSELTGRTLIYELVGDGELMSKLKALVSELQLDHVVVFHGALSHQDAISLMKCADLLLAPSVTANDGDEEGIPIVIMEAMAMGLPVVSTRHAGIPELVCHPREGFLVEERDVVSISEAIIQIAKMSEKDLGDLTLAARSKIEAAFDSDLIFELYIRDFQEIAKRRCQNRLQ